jgi:predicted Zn-dependent peptidase
MSNIENKTNVDYNNNYQKTTLENGLRIITEEVPTAHSFAFGICVYVGSRDDFDTKEGLAHFVEHSVFRRIKGKTSKVISAEFESLGAYTNAFTTKEVICFYVRALNENFRKILNLMFNITINPIFVKKDVDKERDIIVEEIKSYFDEPEELIMDYADSALFEGHRLAHPIIGTEDSVANINEIDIEKFHKTFFTPGNIIISCAGSLSHKEIVNAVKNSFGKLNSKKVIRDKSTPIATMPTNLIFKKDYAQNHLLYCTQIEGYNSRERFTMTALNFILGEGMSSRLNVMLRERHGLVYTVYSNLHFFSDSGVFSIYAGSEKRNTKKIKSLIESELVKLIKSGISTKELHRAKEQLKASTIMALESLSSRMQNLAKSEFLISRYESTSFLIEQIDLITIDDINLCIDKYLRLPNWSQILFNKD